ncbi:Secologanin synthase [Platanthera zijinensis]|uniref:Secologanin synthase n=1 Tax=Platanthera zijinensis TaxID=2320716 RepID=A0AAP0G1F9_9ASPA
MSVVTATVTTALVLWAVWMATWLWWRPRRLESALRGQGLTGTRYRFPSGDLKESAVLARKSCFTWFGPIPAVTIMNPDLIREIFSTKFEQFEKLKISPLGKLLITGLVKYEGEKWARHRRIINPAFHAEKLKRMQPAFSTCCSELIGRWEKFVHPGGTTEIDVWTEFENLTRDVISRTAFGSSYEEGRRIFQLQMEQAKLFIQSCQNVYIPGSRFLPTPLNRQRKQVDREVRFLLRSMIEKRETTIKSSEKVGDDLLSLLIESNLKLFKEHGKSKNGAMTTEEVIEECKLFYIAGQETTNVLLNWTIVLLSMNPSWQERAREEVRQVFGENSPAFDALKDLNPMVKVIMFGTAVQSAGCCESRMTTNNVELGGITYPKGVLLSLPILFIHHDTEIWGEDAKEFNPERFAEGILKATKSGQMAFFPFGWGPRICIGQNFAMTEAKLCLSMILQSFSFELSPSYIHAPHTILTLQPQHGTPIILHRF